MWVSVTWMRGAVLGFLIGVICSYLFLQGRLEEARRTPVDRQQESVAAEAELRELRKRVEDQARSIERSMSTLEKLVEAKGPTATAAADSPQRSGWHPNDYPNWQANVGQEWERMNQQAQRTAWLQQQLQGYSGLQPLPRSRASEPTPAIQTELGRAARDLER